MKRTLQLILAASVAAVALGLTSCGCCSGEAAAPPLRPLPQFQDIPQIHYGK